MTKILVTWLTLLAGVAAPLTLAGCSSTANFPSLPGLDGMGQKTLTPEEQQAKIRELTAAQSGMQPDIQPAVLKTQTTDQPTQ